MTHDKPSSHRPGVPERVEVKYSSRRSTTTPPQPALIAQQGTENQAVPSHRVPAPVIASDATGNPLPGASRAGPLAVVLHRRVEVAASSEPQAALIRDHSVPTLALCPRAERVVEISVINSRPLTHHEAVQAMFQHAATEPEAHRPSCLPSDPHRLEQMFRAHRGAVWRLLRCQGLSPDSAADVTQDVFLVATQRLSDIEVGKERAFLIGTALHIARAAWRARARWQLDGDLEFVDERGMATADRTSALDLVGKILAHIDPPLDEVFVLFEIIEFSALEISDLLVVPPGTVASRVRRAREAFRDAAHRFDHELRREQGQP